MDKSWECSKIFLVFGWLRKDCDAQSNLQKEDEEAFTMCQDTHSRGPARKIAGSNQATPLAPDS
jgi:hypothetical protein